MNAWIWTQAELLARIFLAGICGAVIGYERKNRNKEAGIRTHMIVSLGAALIMVVSKYGFSDILGDAGIALDPSRIAAQIVTGVGFLGAGMIFLRKNTVSGLTTAAGIWATSAIGMAIGSGLYIIGVLTTLLIVVIQILLHGHFIHESYKEEVSFLMQKDKRNLGKLQKQLEQLHIEILNLQVSEQKGSYFVEMTLSLPSNDRRMDLLQVFEDCDYIEEISL
ncbi:MgtC/SapB family protein [[Eubacterium] hominis]|uniref:MgtC/SapB family protein n=1 Tax=[Eubacterium] hominis TaxID=2764325 RepID=UPI003A4E4F20